MHTQKGKSLAAQKWHIENNERSSLVGIHNARAKNPMNERTACWKNVNYANWFSMRLKRRIVLPNRRARKIFSNELFTFMRAQQHRIAGELCFGFVLHIFSTNFRVEMDVKARQSRMLHARFEYRSVNNFDNRRPTNLMQIIISTTRRQPCTVKPLFFSFEGKTISGENLNFPFDWRDDDDEVFWNGKNARKSFTNVS